MQTNILHCWKSDFRAARVIAVYHYLDMPISIKYLDKNTHKSDPEFLKMSPFGVCPVLETKLDYFFQYGAIIRYVTRKMKQKSLTGVLPRHEA
jgi:glutathione S-transferase